MTSVTIGDPDLHIEDPDLIGRRWRTGTLLLILADAAFVAALVFSYLYLRGLNTEKAWLAPKQHIAPIWFSWLIAACARDQRGRVSIPAIAASSPEVRRAWLPGRYSRS